MRDHGLRGRARRIAGLLGRRHHAGRAPRADPITGQGSDNASKGAALSLRRILERGEGPFDALWMQETFEQLWGGYAEKVVGWTNAPDAALPHVLNLLGAAGQLPAVAHRFANGFDDPRDFYEWFMDPTKADAYLAEVASAAWRRSGRAGCGEAARPTPARARA